MRLNSKHWFTAAVLATIVVMNWRIGTAAGPEGTAPPTTQSSEILPQPPRITNSYPLAAEGDREKTVKWTQQLTVDLLATFNDYKEMHWDLTGPLYLPLHEFYQEQADFYRKQADLLAERSLSLGYSVDGRYSTIAKTSKIPELPTGYVTDNESIRLLVDRVAVLQKEVYTAIKELNESDPVTSNKLQDLGYQVDKNLWQLRIHLVRPGGQGETLPWAASQSRDTGEAVPAQPTTSSR